MTLSTLSPTRRLEASRRHRFAGLRPQDAGLNRSGFEGLARLGPQRRVLRVFHRFQHGLSGRKMGTAGGNRPIEQQLLGGLVGPADHVGYASGFTESDAYRLVEVLHRSGPFINRMKLKFRRCELTTLQQRKIVGADVVIEAIDQHPRNHRSITIQARSYDDFLLVGSNGAGLGGEPLRSGTRYSRAVRHNATSLKHNATQCGRRESVASGSAAFRRRKVAA